MTIYDACEKLNKFAEKRGPDGVARAMRLTGCKGVPQESDACVLHNYLSKKFPYAEEVTVTNESAVWRGDRLPYDIYYLGEQLESFIDSFDAGEYPELEVKPCE